MSYSHECDRCSEPHAGDDTDKAFTLLPRLPGFVCVVSRMIPYKASNHLIRPQAGPAAHMAATLRLSGPRLIRVTEYHLEASCRQPLVRYEDARSALEKLGAARQDAGLKTQNWGQQRTT